MDYMNTKSFAQQLGMLLGIDILLGLIYGFVPAEFSPVRSLLAFAQFGFMAITMAVAVREVLRDY
jgi:hypothetical protein